MPNVTAKIDRHQRDGLYELVRNHLGSVGDLWNALEQQEDFAKAERLGIEFGEDFRLLTDIGWQPRDDRESFELTMPTHDLMEVLKRLHGEAATVLSGSDTERESQEEDAETDARFQLGRDACEEVLVGLGKK
jgi:hypothetical protein